MSALLFHGPGACEDALEYANNLGRLLAPPFGEFGLAVDEVREVVSLLTSTVVGSRVGVVLIGPVDRLRSLAAADVLLKPLEEFNPAVVVPVLWAWDAGDVRSTIRSRCEEMWCPYGADPNVVYQNVAMELCRSALKKEWSGVIETMKQQEQEEAAERKRDDRLRAGGRRRAILTACATVLSDAQGTAWLPLWLSIREVLCYHDLSKNEALSALLVGAS